MLYGRYKFSPRKLCPSRFRNNPKIMLCPAAVPVASRRLRKKRLVQRDPKIVRFVVDFQPFHSAVTRNIRVRA
jgi:hypothetical protein